MNNVASDITTIGTLTPGYSLASLESLLEKAAPGDYVQVKRNGSGGPHSMIVVNVNAAANTIEIYDANAVAKNTVGHYTQTFDYFKQRNAGVSVYRYKDYIKGHNPEGAYDAATGGVGCVSVRGWAFDQDDKSKALQIHVYIGGEAGAGGEGHVIIANKYRPDVGAACQGVGDYHGFDEKIYTTRTGKQDVYVYAINIGAENYNTCLGKKTVTITKDTTKPVISNAKVSNITKTGYTVTFKASDNVGITRFWLPTWADPNGQDDLKDEPYTKSGDTLRYT